MHLDQTRLVCLSVWQIHGVGYCKDPMSLKDDCDPSAIFNEWHLSDWLSHLVWFVSHDFLFYWIKWVVICSSVYNLYSSHTTYIQRCVDHYPLKIFLWHYIILGHIYDITMFQAIVMSWCPFACGVVMTPLLMLNYNHYLAKSWHKSRQKGYRKRRIRSILP